MGKLRFKSLLFSFFILSLLVFLAGPSLASSSDKKDADKSQTAQKQKTDKQTAQEAKQHIEITVTAPRVEIALKAVPAATTVVETQILQTMPRTIAIDEALKLTPGVKVDNQADGERVHLSIRGQGILTERGTRGVKTLVDGIPLNDPSGFVSDFFDVDWATVKRIEVLRGPAAAFYGSGSWAAS